jgi:hypothetical protein
VRVIDYTIDDGRDREPVSYRLLITLLDLAAAYAHRWEIESAFEELKTHQRVPRTVLRSKSPDLVTQEIWGHLCCHYASAPSWPTPPPTPEETPTACRSWPPCASPDAPPPTTK